MADRHYMNKMFGQKLDNARALEEKRHGRRKEGSVKRVTVEPDDDGKGHHVTIERVTAVAVPHQPQNPDEGIEKHSFAGPQEIMQFLHSVLGGHDSDQAEEEREGIRGPNQRGGPKEEIAEEQENGGDEVPGENENGGGLLSRILSVGMHRS